MPYKLNHDRRHHIVRQQHKMTNWPAYEAGLRQRGNLTVWFSGEAIAAWQAEPRTTRGGQGRYSSLAILTALTMRAVFRLAYRQAEGLIGSNISLLDLTLQLPDHTTLSRRSATLSVTTLQPPTAVGGDARPLHLLVDSTGLKLCGAGEWLIEKHGTKTRRARRKLHLGVDGETGQIMASALTSKEIDDGALTGALFDQLTDPVSSFTAAGTYDQDSVYTAVAERHPEAAVIVPPRTTATLSGAAPPTQRDHHLLYIAENGRTAWQKVSLYNRRSKVEAAIGRWKHVIGDGLRSRVDEHRATEVSVAAHVLNRMLALGRPDLSPRRLTPCRRSGAVVHITDLCTTLAPTLQLSSIGKSTHDPDGNTLAAVFATGTHHATLIPSPLSFELVERQRYGRRSTRK